MSLLASGLASLFFLITVVFLYIVASFVTVTPSSFATTSNLIRLPGLSLSTSYLGDRILEYKEVNDVVYIGVKKDTYASFVYEK